MEITVPEYHARALWQSRRTMFVVMFFVTGSLLVFIRTFPIPAVFAVALGGLWVLFVNRACQYTYILGPRGIEMASGGRTRALFYAFGSHARPLQLSQMTVLAVEISDDRERPVLILSVENMASPVMIPVLKEEAEVAADYINKHFIA